MSTRGHPNSDKDGIAFETTLIMYACSDELSAFAKLRSIEA